VLERLDRVEKSTNEKLDKPCDDTDEQSKTSKKSGKQ